MRYREFLEGKMVQAPESGFVLEERELSPALKPHQRAGVLWALRGGRRALFESFGLGKTIQQLEWCRQVVRHEGGRALIVLPLGVRQEFRRDAGWKGLAAVPWRETREEAQADLDALAMRKGWQEIDGCASS